MQRMSARPVNAFHHESGGGRGRAWKSERGCRSSPLNVAIIPPALAWLARCTHDLHLRAQHGTERWETEFGYAATLQPTSLSGRSTLHARMVQRRLEENPRQERVSAAHVARDCLDQCPACSSARCRKQACPACHQFNLHDLTWRSTWTAARSFLGNRAPLPIPNRTCATRIRGQ